MNKRPGNLTNKDSFDRLSEVKERQMKFDTARAATTARAEPDA
jgi:hypothetical protein